MRKDRYKINIPVLFFRIYFQTLISKCQFADVNSENKNCVADWNNHVV